MLRIPRIDFASIKILLYEISTSKSHLLAALTNSLTSSVAFNLIFFRHKYHPFFYLGKKPAFFRPCCFPVYSRPAAFFIWLFHIMSHIVRFVKLMFFIVFKSLSIKTRILYDKIRVFYIFIVQFLHFRFSIHYFLL